MEMLWVDLWYHRQDFSHFIETCTECKLTSGSSWALKQLSYIRDHSLVRSYTYIHCLVVLGTGKYATAPSLELILVQRSYAYDHAAVCQTGWQCPMKDYRMGSVCSGIDSCDSKGGSNDISANHVNIMSKYAVIQGKINTLCLPRK